MMSSLNIENFSNCISSHRSKLEKIKTNFHEQQESLAIILENDTIQESKNVVFSKYFMVVLEVLTDLLDLHYKFIVDKPTKARVENLDLSVNKFVRYVKSQIKLDNEQGMNYFLRLEKHVRKVCEQVADKKIQCIIVSWGLLLEMWILLQTEQVKDAISSDSDDSKVKLVKNAMSEYDLSKHKIDTHQEQLEKIYSLKKQSISNNSNTSDSSV